METKRDLKATNCKKNKAACKSLEQKRQQNSRMIKYAEATPDATVREYLMRQHDAKLEESQSWSDHLDCENRFKGDDHYEACKDVYTTMAKMTHKKKEVENMKDGDKKFSDEL